MSLTFNQRIFIVASALITLSLLIFSSVSYYKVKFYLENEINAKQMNLMKSLQVDVNSWMQPGIHIITELTKELELQKDFKKEEIVPILSHAKRASNAVQVYLGLEDGRMMYDSGKELKQDWYDPRGRPWYTQGMDATKTIVTDPFVGFASNQLTVCMVSPIVIEGKKQGVVAASYYVNRIYKKVKAIGLEGSYAFVMDDKGKLIIHPDKDLVNMNIQEQNLAYKNFYEYALSHKEGSYRYRFENDEKLITFGELNNGWFAVVTVQKEVAYSFIDTLLKQFLIMGILMVAISVIILVRVIQKNTEVNNAEEEKI